MERERERVGLGKVGFCCWRGQRVSAVQLLGGWSGGHADCLNVFFS